MSSGICGRCHRGLRDPQSVQRGMGPVCYSRAAVDATNDPDNHFCDRFLTEPHLRERIVLHRSSDAVFTNVPHLVTHHSPTGFEWGYGGSGPADLALNICEMLAVHLGVARPSVPCYRDSCSRFAWDAYQEFKRLFVAPADREHAEIPWTDVLEWGQARLARVEQRELLEPGADYPAHAGFAA